MNPLWLTGIDIASPPTRYAYIHNGRARSSTAFELSKKSEITLYIPRSLSAGEVYLEIYDEALDTLIKEYFGAWSGTMLHIPATILYVTLLSKLWRVTLLT